MRRRKSPHKLFHFISFSVERKKKKSLLDSIRYDGNFLDFVNGATETMSDDGKKINTYPLCRYVGKPQENFLSSPSDFLVPRSIIATHRPGKTKNHRNGQFSGERLGSIQKLCFFNLLINEPQRCLIETNLC